MAEVNVPNVPLDPVTGKPVDPFEPKPILLESKIDHDKLGKLLVLSEKLAAHGTALNPLKAGVDRQINELVRQANVEEADYAKRLKAEQDRVAALRAKADADERARIEALAKKDLEDRAHAEALNRAKAQAGSPVRRDDQPPLFPLDSGVVQKDTNAAVQPSDRRV